MASNLESSHSLLFQIFLLGLEKSIQCGHIRLQFLQAEPGRHDTTHQTPPVQLQSLRESAVTDTKYNYSHAESSLMMILL